VVIPAIYMIVPSRVRTIAEEKALMAVEGDNEA
jgi:hypothetical protein